MQGHGVICVVVDAFNDIDFSVVRPIGTKQPERRPDKISAEGAAAKPKDARKDKPCTANSAWHVGDIKGEQTVGVGCIARDAHAVSAGPVGNMGAVDTHVDKVVIGVNIAVLGCCVLIDIVHITSSGIR